MENEDLLKIEKSLFSDTSKYRDISTPRGMFLKLIRQ